MKLLQYFFAAYCLIFPGISFGSENQELYDDIKINFGTDIEHCATLPPFLGDTQPIAPIGFFEEDDMLLADMLNRQQLSDNRPNTQARNATKLKRRLSDGDAANTTKSSTKNLKCEEKTVKQKPIDNDKLLRKMLHSQILAGDKTTVKTLLANGADPNKGTYCKNDDRHQPALRALERALSLLQHQDNREHYAKIIMLFLEDNLVDLTVLNPVYQKLLSNFLHDIEKLVLTPTNANMLKAVVLINRNRELITNTNIFNLALARKAFVVVQHLLKNSTDLFTRKQIKRSLQIANASCQRLLVNQVNEIREYQQALQVLSALYDSLSEGESGPDTLDSSDTTFMDENMDENDEDLQQALILSLEPKEQAQSNNSSNTDTPAGNYCAEVYHEVHEFEFNALKKIDGLIKSNPGTIREYDERGRTWVHHAALNNFPEVIRYLASQGADLHALDFEGRTAYQLALDSGNRQAAVVLIELEAHQQPSSSTSTSAQDPIALHLQRVRNQERIALTNPFFASSQSNTK